MGARAHEPLVHLERAELGRALGDDALLRGELETAQRRFAELGATHHVERLARELADG
jgi:hypothetical protein